MVAWSSHAQTRRRSGSVTLSARQHAQHASAVPKATDPVVRSRKRDTCSKRASSPQTDALSGSSIQLIPLPIAIHCDHAVHPVTVIAITVIDKLTTPAVIHTGQDNTSAEMANIGLTATNTPNHAPATNRRFRR